MAEELGYHSIWSSEAWGQDAFTPLAFIAAATESIGLGTAIAQNAARTPTATAMTALTLQGLSGGRLQLGLGVSGPQVVEGWHGVPFGKPLAKTREYVEVLRLALVADRRVVDVAAGVLPYPWSPSRWEQAWGDLLADAKPGFAIAPTVLVAIDDDMDRARDAVRPRLALHIGGMGARGKNFYHALMCRYGFASEADEIQDRYLSGDRDGANRALTDEMVDDLALVGPSTMVAQRLSLWRSSPATTLIAEPLDQYSLEELARVW